MAITQTPSSNRIQTAEYAARIKDIMAQESHYGAAKQIAHEILGARPLSAQGSVLFGFWVPGVDRGRLASRLEQINLEIFTPTDDDLLSAVCSSTATEAEFRRTLLPLTRAGEYLFAVVDEVAIGTRSTLGALYWLTFADAGNRRLIRDPLAVSLPFGVYAPAEVFDLDGMLAARRDMEYFRTHNRAQLPDGSYRARDIGTHLEIHTETATADGTFAALTQRFAEIGAKIQTALDAGEDRYARLDPADLNFVGFDSIELTPEVPPAEREDAACLSGDFFRFIDADRRADNPATVQLRRPDISNWGYDTPILGSAAVNPSLLESLRPNEFLAFIETLHLMPGGPIQICIDSVLGHCDFQGARLLRTFETDDRDEDNPKYINSAYLRGANMYGRDIDFSQPEVKALLLELLKRKLNYGFDAVRVDGAQDFIAERDETTGLRIQDDEFLNEMANVVTVINGVVRRPDFNLEDGRPWPDDLNWLYNSKYLDHTIERTLPYDDRVKQWSPIIFAHNVHAKFKWFMNKWDRFVEVFRYGENWITGHSNHDNARYFYRMTAMKPSSEYVAGEPFEEYYNDYLGDTMPEAAHNALDNPALSAVSLAFLPGNPMFLLNALFHTPWTFARDIDVTYAVKIVAEEGSPYFTWYVDDALYAQPGFYPRLKALGFATLRSLVAPPAEKPTSPGFADRLYTLRMAVKTDVLIARFLFDDPGEGGGYADSSALIQAAGAVDREALEARIAADPRESARKVAVARTLYRKTLAHLERGVQRAPDSVIESLTAQVGKLRVLRDLPDNTIALLLEDADSRDDYDPARWAHDAVLVELAPEQMRDATTITPAALFAYARAFMLDAREAATVARYEESVDAERARYNLALRRFRQEHPWLLRNPTNDVRRDYFARKLLTNGAKDTGEWSDKGDVVNCNTIYYGWRTSPDDQSQVFVIANMEGAPIDRCPLSLFLNLSGTWRVAAAAPSMGRLPESIDSSYVISNFQNGEALVLVR